MALTNLGSTLLTPSNEGAGPNVSKTLNFDQEYNIFAMCYLVQVDSPPGFGGFGYSQVWISEYVQSGTPKPGTWQLLNEDNVSSVTFTALATSASVQAIGLVFSR
jgi:hypothetical protein